MKRFIWHDPVTGGLCVFTPAYNDIARLEEGDDGVLRLTTTDDEFLEAARIKAVPAGVQSWDIDDDDPQVNAFLRNRVNRHAWNHDNGQLFVDPAMLNP